MIQYGIIEGMFKVKMSGLPDCTAEGMTLWRAAGRLANRMRLEGAVDEDYLNLFQMWLALASRCNYFTTVEGVIVSRQIGETLDHWGGFWSAILAPLWLIAEVAANFLDDVYIILTAFLSWQTHSDFFNFGIILGKVLKICFQYYLEGFFFQYLDEDVDIDGKVDM